MSAATLVPLQEKCFADGKRGRGGVRLFLPSIAIAQGSLCGYCTLCTSGKVEQTAALAARPNSLDDRELVSFSIVVFLGVSLPGVVV